MLVQSHDKHSEVAEFDPESGRLRRVEHDDAGTLLDQPLRGHFADLEGVEAILYRCGEQLSLRVAGKEAPATAETVRWAPDGSHAVLSIVEAGHVVASARYHRGPSTGPSLADDPTPFVEAEDWDFGLFVRNVIGDAERARSIYR